MGKFLPGLYVTDIFGGIYKFMRFEDEEFVLVSSIRENKSGSENIVNMKVLRPFWIQPDETIKIIDRKSGIMVKMIEVNRITLTEEGNMILYDGFGSGFTDRVFKFEI